MRERMAGQNSPSNLQDIVEAIRSSDVVESRAELITKLGDLDISDKSDLASIAEFLCTFWEDFTCLDVSQCMLNKTILYVAGKYLGLDISGCLDQFLMLGTKASIWCRKHLKMTLMSNGESQEEEHSTLFYQLLLDCFSFSADTFLALTRYPVLDDKDSRGIVENFTLEQLNLTKEAISEAKRTPSFGSEILKEAQSVLNAAIRVCRVYSQSVNWELYEHDKSGIDCQETYTVNCAINMITSTIEKLCQIGIRAANDGGNLVTILNVSWKGVVTLLQLCKGALAVKVNVPGIILTLISLANESLRCAAEAWSSSLMEAVSIAEARKTFLPVKFYLINAARISSQYPLQAFLIYKEIILFVLMISTFRVSLSKEPLTNAAAEVLTELLEKTSLDLLNSLLNSVQLKQELKFEILDWIFTNEKNSLSLNEEASSTYRKSSMDAIFSVNCEAMPQARILLVGRFALFLDFLKSSELEEDVQLAITRKLGWLLDILVDEEVYSSVLVLRIPTLYGSGQTAELAWQPMFPYLLHALKTFMVITSSTPSWRELESFLLENFFHPQFLCWEIVMELWCFMVHHAAVDLVTDLIDQLCSLFKLVACTKSVFRPGSALRKMARSICMLISSDGTQYLVDRVYSSVINDDRGQYSSIMHVVLLMEGFPLNLLSDNLKSSARERIVTDYYGFIESFDGVSLRSYGSGVYEAPVFALSAALQSLQISISDIDGKTLKFIVAIIQYYRNSVDSLAKDYYRKLLSETLGIISNMKNLYESDAMEEVILELQGLFVSRLAASDAQLIHCKPNLALFLAGLGHMEMAESDKSAKNSAVWELYHILLRERHWAFVHLAITAFGYFAARTTCNQLWRFVPQTAALSFDLVSGNKTNEESFMSELKAFLEKEMALLTLTPSSDQHELLVKEGLALKEMAQKIPNIDLEPMGCEVMEIERDDNQANKRRKLPDGISKGVELLRSGLKVIGDGISKWQQNDSIELHHNLLAYFSRLEDVIGDLVGLAGNG